MERITEAGAVFETDHRGCSAMRHHRHESPFVTIVLRGAYVEVSDSVPELCSSGTIVVHDATEEHADRFASDTRYLNVELPRGLHETHFSRAFRRHVGMTANAYRARARIRLASPRQARMLTA